MTALRYTDIDSACVNFFLQICIYAVKNASLRAPRKYALESVNYVVTGDKTDSFIFASQGKLCVVSLVRSYELEVRLKFVIQLK